MISDNELKEYLVDILLSSGFSIIHTNTILCNVDRMISNPNSVVSIHTWGDLHDYIHKIWRYAENNPIYFGLANINKLIDVTERVGYEIDKQAESSHDFVTIDYADIFIHGSPQATTATTGATYAPPVSPIPDYLR